MGLYLDPLGRLSMDSSGAAAVAPRSLQRLHAQALKASTLKPCGAVLRKRAVGGVFLYVYIYMYICVFICSFVYVYNMCIYVYLYMYVHICTYMYICVYTHIYIYVDCLVG